MSISAIGSPTVQIPHDLGKGPARTAAKPASPLEQAKEVRDVFRDFVGETFYRQMLKSMRDTVGKPAYFHGGRGEEVFTSQLDQVLVEKLSAANGSAFSDGMFAQAFPRLAAVLREAQQAQYDAEAKFGGETQAASGAEAGEGSRLDDLTALFRR